MITKTLELRDRATFIPILAVEIRAEQGEDDYLIARSGYGSQTYIMITSLLGARKAHFDPTSWNDRTWQVAHLYITNHWRELSSGDVIDVEFILGETKTKKLSERYE